MNGSNFTMGWTGVVVYSGAYQTGVDGRILEVFKNDRISVLRMETEKSM